jgi:hypothetical protein
MYLHPRKPEDTDLPTSISGVMGMVKLQFMFRSGTGSQISVHPKDRCFRIRAALMPSLISILASAMIFIPASHAREQEYEAPSSMCQQ